MSNKWVIHITEQFSICRQTLFTVGMENGKKSENPRLIPNLKHSMQHATISR